MDYKKLYEKAVERAKTLTNSGFNDFDFVKHIFPELTESEDERIRKAIGYAIGQSTHSDGTLINGISSEEALAWLEKQYADPIKEYWRGYNEGKQNVLDKYAELEKQGKTFTKKDVDDAYLKGVCDAKQELEKQGEKLPVGFYYVNSEGKKFYSDTFKYGDVILHVEKQGEQKPTDKAEPKFKNGQWIVWQGKCYKVNYNGCGYELVDQNGLGTSLEYGTIDENAHLWDITEDAKDGDVLVHNAVTFIFMGIENGIVKGICTELSDTILNFGEPEYDNDYCPTTKEQRDTLMKAMTDAGYRWNPNEKKLEKIEQKPTDKDMVEALRTEYEKGRADAFAQMQKEWSEEDEEKRNNCIYWLEKARKYFEQDEDLIYENKWLIKCIDWLKSLKARVSPQQKWKPSDKQIEVLWKYAEQNNYDGMLLTSLYNDLKKLREE